MRVRFYDIEPRHPDKTALSSIERRRGALPCRAGGYVLIYIAAILLFLSSVVVTIAASLREDAQLAISFRDRTQADYLFEAALQYGLAQIAKAGAVAAAEGSLTDMEKAELDPWQKDHHYEIVIDDELIDFSFIDGGGLVDANYVSAEEFLRYFEALPLAEQDIQGTPEEWVDALLLARVASGQKTQTAGFTSLNDITSLEALPYVVRFGQPATLDVDATGKEHIIDAGIPSISESFSIGTAVRSLSIEHAPLALFAALCDANQDQLKKIAELRSGEKPPTLADFVRILGESSRSLLTEGRSSPYVRIIMSMTTRGGGVKKQNVLIKMEGASYTIIDRSR